MFPPRFEKAVRQQLRENLLSQHCAGLAESAGVRERPPLQLPPGRPVMEAAAHFQTRDPHGGHRLHAAEMPSSFLPGPQQTGGRLPSLGVSKERMQLLNSLQIPSDCCMAPPPLPCLPPPSHQQLRSGGRDSMAQSSQQLGGGGLPQLAMNGVVLPQVEDLQGFFSQSLQLRD